MDYISEAAFDAYPHDSRVPCLCEYEYDGLDFSSYPERKGFNKNLLHTGNFSEQPEDETIEFIQSWLFFGLLSQVTKKTIAIADLTTEGPDGELLIDAKRIPDYIQSWVRSSRPHEEDRVESLLSEARAIIEYMCPPLLTLQSKYGSLSPKEVAEAEFSIIPAPIACSIALVAASLRITFTQQHPVSPYVRFSLPASDVFGIPSEIIRRFLDAGWCISDVARLSRSYSINTLYYASTFHRDLPSPEFHDRCDLYACSASQVDDATYITKHINEECECDHMYSQLKTVKDILDDQKIPAVVIEEDPKPSFKTVAFEDCRPVALSHVWSDGLGNVHANSIPECQVRRIKGLIDELYKTSSKGGLFKSKKYSSPPGLWLDTLCIPLEKFYRKLAIKKMVETYAKSDRVLVLDAELAKISVADCHGRELLVRIAGSNWMRRMWTLQEAALNIENLYIQFADGIFKFNEISWELTRSWEKQKFVYEAIDIDVSSFSHEFSYLNKAYGKDYWRDAVDAVGLALAGFAGRNTSKAGDAFLCFGGMMGLDVGEIASTPDEARTEKVLSMLHYFPKSIIFSQGPKLDTPGYGWACETFWKSTVLSSAYYDGMEVAKVKDEGLRLIYPGFVVKPFKIPEQYFLFNDEKQNLWMKVTFDTTDPVHIREKIVRTKHDEESMNLGLIVPDVSVARKGAGNGSPGLLVSIYKTAGWKDALKDSKNMGALYSRTLCTVRLTTVSEEEIEGYQSLDLPVATGKKPNERSGGANSMVYMSQTWYLA